MPRWRGRARRRSRAQALSSRASVADGAASLGREAPVRLRSLRVAGGLGSAWRSLSARGPPWRSGRPCGAAGWPWASAWAASLRGASAQALGAPRERLRAAGGLGAAARGAALPSGCRGRGRPPRRGSGRRGAGGGHWQASPSQGGGGRGGLGEAAADAGVVDVDRAGVLGHEARGGGEEDVCSVGGGVDEFGVEAVSCPRRSGTGSRRRSE